MIENGVKGGNGKKDHMKLEEISYFISKNRTYSSFLGSLEIRG